MAIQRDSKGFFLKGAPSPNPGGKNKHDVRAEIIKAGAEIGASPTDIWKMFFQVSLGRMPAGMSVDAAPSIANRLHAGEYILDHFHGKPKQSVELSTEPLNTGLAAIDIDSMSDEEFERYERAQVEAYKAVAMIKAAVIDVKSED
jgi:hypothetical protein